MSGCFSLTNFIKKHVLKLVIHCNWPFDSGHPSKSQPRTPNYAYMLSRISNRFPEDVCSDLLVFAKRITQLSNNATPIEGNWMLAMSDRGEIAGASEWYHYSALATIYIYIYIYIYTSVYTSIFLSICPTSGHYLSIYYLPVYIYVYIYIFFPR